MPDYIQARFAPNVGTKKKTIPKESSESSDAKDPGNKDHENESETSSTVRSSSMKSKKGYNTRDFMTTNLLIALVYADIVEHKTLSRLPGCAVDDSDLVLKQLNKLRAFRSNAQLANALEKCRNHSIALLETVVTIHGGEMKYPSGKWKIDHFDESVLQFSVSKPNAKLEKAFEPFFLAEKGESKLAFHGTSLSNLRSILTTGFFTSQDLHLAEEPTECYGYAFKVPKEGDEINGKIQPSLDTVWFWAAKSLVHRMSALLMIRDPPLSDMSFLCRQGAMLPSVLKSRSK